MACPTAFMDRYFGLLEAFFALPEATKATIDKRRSPHFRGWERVGSELTNNQVDYREQLDVSTEHPPYGPDAEPAYLRLDGPNQWLDERGAPRLPGHRRGVLRPARGGRGPADGGDVARASGWRGPSDAGCSASGPNPSSS